MTKLTAVNIMLEALGEPPVTALSITPGDIEYEAETILDRVTREVLTMGWAQNIEWDVELEIATVKILASGGTGTFTFGETVTESTSNATGTFAYETGGAVYLYYVSGTFTGGQTLTGGTSGATRTGSTYSAVTESRLAIDPAFITIRPDANEYKRFTPRDGYLYDLDDNTYTFTRSVKVRLVRLLAITALTERLAKHITYEAAMRFQLYKKRGQIDDTYLRNMATRARVEALQEDGDIRGANVLRTDEAIRIKGSRNYEAEDVA